MQPKLGIIAGGGSLPRRIIDICRASNRPYYVIAVEGHAEPDSVSDTPHSWIRIGTAGTVFKTLKAEHVEEIVMIGDVKLPTMRELRPDFITAMFFAKIGMKALGDNSLLSAAAKDLEKEGFKVIGVDAILNNLLAPEGLLGSVGVPEEAAADIKIGIKAALELGQRDVGQAVIVKAGLVIVEEDQAGTADMIKRSQETTPVGEGGVLIKLKKPGQDRRIDLPTIGRNTILQAKEAGLKGIVVQAQETLIVDLDAVITTANEADIFLKSVHLAEME